MFTKPTSYRFITLISVLAVFIFASSAAASDFHMKKDHKFGSKQYGYSQVWLDSSGSGKLYSKYSNCHRVDGDTYATFAILKDKSGRKLETVEIRAGMNAQLIGCNERELDKKFQVPAEKMSQVASVEIVHREINSKDDGQIIGLVLAIIEKILEEPPKSEANGVYWKS